MLAQSASDPAKSTLTLNDDGSFAYTPNKKFKGTDFFTYRASDGTDEATVTIKAGKKK